MTFAGYALAVSLSFYMQAYYGYAVSELTYWIYIVLTLSITSGAILTGVAMRKAPERKYETRKYELKLSKSQFLWLLAFQTVIFLIFLYDYNKVVGGISIAHIGETINRYRVLSSYGGNISLSFVTEQLIKVTTAISFVALYYMAASSKFNFKNFCFTALQILPSAVIQLLTGARFQFVIYIVFFAIIFFYKRLERKITFRTLLLVVALGVGGLALFSLSRGIVGRGQNQSVFLYIGHYFGKSIISLDYFMRRFTGPTYNPDRIFYGISSFLEKFGLYEIGVIHNEFVTISGVSMGNVYGGVMDYFKSFSFGGVVFFGILFGALSMYLYYKATYKNSQKYDFALILYAMLAYTFLLDCFDGYLFRTVFSLNFVVEAALIWFIIRFILREKNEKGLMKLTQK